MDVRLHGNAQYPYSVNGGAYRDSTPGQKDDTLQYLSPEEQECIQFFEDTIDSVDEGPDDRDRGPAPPRHLDPGPVSRVDGLQVSNHHTPAVPVPPHQDIIDLVHPEPDLVPPREPMFNPASPDFQRLLNAPESHFEIKPRHESLPPEYNLPMPMAPMESQPSYHPPGSVPTPVLIAQKIAENQGGGPVSFHPPVVLRRLSLESDQSLSDSSDHSGRHGPPTSSKPPRLPPNITMVAGGRDQARTDENVLERRDSGNSNPSVLSHSALPEHLQQAPDSKPHNTPTRSFSFKDPTPDKSRMEALSKLGLTRNRAMSGDVSPQITRGYTSIEPLSATSTPPRSPDTALPQSYYPDSNVTKSPLSFTNVERKPEVLQTTQTHKILDERSYHASSPSPPFSQTRHQTPNPESREIRREPTPPPEVTSRAFNSYGGKSMMVHPSGHPRSEPSSSPTTYDPKPTSPVLSSPIELNPYGGKTKVMTPVPVSMTRADLPDILSSHIDKSHTFPSKLEPQSAELNSYGGKSRNIHPAQVVHRPGTTPPKSIKGPAPTPAPRPPRHSYHGIVSPPKVSPVARKSSSAFRPQCITVQFSGRGPMNDSRREALRKLGLLKDS